jgi:hypothetical protein
VHPKIVFVIAVILAVISLLPVLGMAVAILGAYSYWLLLVASSSWQLAVC